MNSHINPSSRAATTPQKKKRPNRHEALHTTPQKRKEHALRRDVTKSPEKPKNKKSKVQPSVLPIRNQLFLRLQNTEDTTIDKFCTKMTNKHIAELSLEGLSLMDDKLSSIFSELPNVASLVYLNLSHNQMGNACLKLLTELIPDIKQLTRIDLSFNGVLYEQRNLSIDSEPDIASLDNFLAVCKANNITVSLIGNEITPEVAKQLSVSPWPGLTMPLSI